MPVPVQAQNPTTVDPRHYAVTFKNDVVRVLRVTYPPGERSEMHAHPPSVTVVLDDARFRLSFPDGESSEPRLQAGRVLWGAGAVHEPRNIGRRPARLMMVELRSPRVAEGIRHQESPPHPIDLGPGMTGEALIDNDLVAVRRVMVAPGGHSEPHANANRHLLVLPRAGALTMTIGAERVTVAPGQVRFILRGTTHAESNPGTDPVEWIAILIEREPERAQHRDRRP